MFFFSFEFCSFEIRKNVIRKNVQSRPPFERTLLFDRNTIRKNDRWILKERNSIKQPIQFSTELNWITCIYFDCNWFTRQTLFHEKWVDRVFYEWQEKSDDALIGLLIRYAHLSACSVSLSHLRKICFLHLVIRGFKKIELT